MHKIKSAELFTKVTLVKLVEGIEGGLMRNCESDFGSREVAAILVYPLPVFLN